MPQLSFSADFGLCRTLSVELVLRGSIDPCRGASPHNVAREFAAHPSFGEVISSVGMFEHFSM